MKKRLAWAAAALLTLAFLVWFLRPQPIPVDLAQPQRLTVNEYIAEEAKTRVAHDYLIDAPFPGRLLTLVRDAGDTVEKGEVIARMDPFDLEQQARSLEARIEQAQAQVSGVDIAKPKPHDYAAAAIRVKEATDGLHIATRDRDTARLQSEEATREATRAITLAQQGAISRADRERAEWQRDTAHQNLLRAQLAVEAADKRLQLAHLDAQRVDESADDNEYLRRVYHAEAESMRAQLRVIRNDLARANITAPARGIILERLIDSPRTLMAGAPIYLLGDPGTIEIEADILSEEVVQVQPGNPVAIFGKALQGEEAQGAVKRIYPAAFMRISALGIEQQRVKVLIDFDDTPHGLRPGTRLDVRIITAESTNTLAVPERAIFRTIEGWHLFTVEGRRAILTPIQVGLKNEQWAEILSGLDPNATIILDPPNDLTHRHRITQRKS